MFSKTLAVFAPLSFLLTGVLAQDKNITVPDTDPSIVYSGQGTGDADICKLDANGNLVGGQAGCYNFPSQCTSSVAMSQNTDGKAGATFKFKGSAIYVNSGLDDISPVFTVTLDGQSTDADGVRPSLGFTCDLLFSKTGLDPTVEHTISLSVKGPSPNRNMTTDPQGTALVFSLIDFIYTSSDSSSNSSSSSSGSSSSGSGSSNSSSGSSSSGSSTSSASGPSSSSSSGTGAPQPTNSGNSNTSTTTDDTKGNSAANMPTASILKSGVLILGSWLVLGATGFYVL